LVAVVIAARGRGEDVGGAASEEAAVEVR